MPNDGYCMDTDCEQAGIMHKHNSTKDTLCVVCKLPGIWLPNLQTWAHDAAKAGPMGHSFELSEQPTEATLGDIQND